MNTNEFKTSKTISAPREAVFKYFITPELIEKWSAPEGMTLKVPSFEAKAGGRYRYEHTAKDGVYLCEGHIIDLKENEKLVQCDEYIKGPDGKFLGKYIENTISLKDVAAGTEVSVVVKGKFDDKFKNDCEMGWTSCLDQLSALIAKDYGTGFKATGEVRPTA